MAQLFISGGQGSGHHGHKGRIGEVGGSTDEEGGRTMPSKLSIRAGFDNAEFRGKLKEAATYLSEKDVPKSINVFNDPNNRRRYGTSGGGNAYINQELCKDKPVSFIASVIKHESIHVLKPSLSETDVRIETLQWAKDTFGSSLESETIDLLDDIDTGA